MTFLSPALLAGLIPLVALPLIIHLFNKGFPRHFKFPSVELIKETMARRSKLHKWRHWILLLLRTAFLILLLLAFLQPVLKRFGGDPMAKGHRSVLIVLDHSVSMEHKGDGPTSRERAVHEARKLIESLGPQDTVNILLLTHPPSTAFVNWSKDHAEAKRFLALLPPGLGRGDVNLANARAAQLFSRKTPRPEIYYISDFQRKNWSNADFTALPASVRLFFVDVGPTRRDNRAILTARLNQDQILAGDTVMLEITIGNFSAEPFNDRITVALGGQLSFDREVSIAPWSQGQVALPLPAGGPGLHLCEVRLPPDALAYDNRYCLTLAVQEKEEVLIVTDGPQDRRSGSYFLKTALNPFANQGGSLLPRVLASSELTPNRLAGVSKMFFTQINRLPVGTDQAIAQFLFRGGGLIYFLDGATDGENLRLLEAALGPGTMPVVLTQKRAATNVVAGAQQIVRGQFRSRYLKLFQGGTRQDLGLLEFYDYYQGSATGAGEVLLFFGDDSPALAVTHHGLGTLLLLNFSAGELSSNLARQRIFPAWMQDLVKAVSINEPPPAAFTIGETLQAEVWRSEMKNDELRNPDGNAISVKRNVAGDRYQLAFVPQQLGFYTLGRPRPRYAFAVNTSPEEADLRPIDMEVLPAEFAADRPVHFVAGQADFEELAKGRPLFHWFVLAGLAFLALETGFQYLLRRVAG